MNKNSLSSLNSFNFVNSNDEDMVHSINELVDLIKEHYKIIKNEIKEGKTLSSNEKLDLNIILNIESQLNSFFSKAKEIINKLKLTRKRKKQCEKESKTFNLISPKSNMNLYKNIKFNMNLSYIYEKELKSCNSQKNVNQFNNNNFISIEKYKNNIICKNKHKKYNSKESKNSTNDDTSFDFKQNLYLKRIKKNESENNNNFNHSNPKNIKVNKSKLSDYKEKTNYCLDNKYINEYKLQNDTIIKNNLTISKMKSEIENLQKQLKKEKNRNINIKTKNKEPLNKKKNKLEDNIMKNLEIKITKLTSDLKNSNDLYSKKLSNIKKEMENHIENIMNLKNEIEEYDKYCENEYLKNNSLLNKTNSENYYLDLIEKDKLKISELSKINDELSNKNNELSLNNLELNNSKSKLLNENSQLITVKKELENKINNLKKQLEIMKENKENNINYSFSNMTNNSNLVIFSKDNESDNDNENEKEKEKVNESIIVNKKNKNEKSEQQITQEIKELQNEIKIKDLTINTLTEEINIKDNQISQLIVEKANLSNYQNNLNKSKLNRSQSEKIYSKLQKENNELIKQLSKITNNLGKIMDENEYNKIRISKLNKKLNDKDNFQSKEIIEKYEQKLKEINNKYKKNEIYLQEQINELKLSNIEKDENNKALQNEYLKLKWDIEEKK